MSDIQDKIDELMSKLPLDDAPAGGALVVYHQGECVVQSHVGQANDGMDWTPETLSLNFSAGKGVLATLVHILVSKGYLNYQQPIADIWSEFGANGKADINLQAVLSHQAGLFDITSVTSDGHDMLNWQGMLASVANMTPTPLSADEKSDYSSIYSALVYGWVIGGLIEKRMGQPLQAVLEEHLTLPLGIADSVFFGIPSDKVKKVAQPKRRFSSVVSDDAHMRRKPVLKPDSQRTLAIYGEVPSASCWQEQLAEKTLNTTNINGLYFNTQLLDLVAYKQALVPNGQHGFDYYDESVLQAVIPAANGVSSANALAKIYAMLAQNGQWQGQRLIDEQTFQSLSQIQGYKRDKVMPAISPESMYWRLGYHRLFTVCHQAKAAFGHMGYNGSVAWCDPERQLALAFVHNFDTTMLNDVRQFILTEAILSYF